MYLRGQGTMKALILSGGTGSRFNSLTKSFPKQLLPVMGKPVLFYGIESIVHAGIKEIYIVIWKNGNKIIDRVGNGKRCKIIPYPEDKRNIEPGHVYLDATKIFEDVGWKPKISFENGVKGIVNLEDYVQQGGVFSHFSNL